MCLGVPGQIVCIEGQEAVVEFWGVRRRVRLDVVDSEVEPGDYVLNHVGFAIRRIPASEVEATLRLYDELRQAVEKEDLMLAELEAEQRALPRVQGPLTQPERAAGAGSADERAGRDE